jgi:hypothetical protein
MKFRDCYKTLHVAQELNTPGVALALDLLDEITRLRNQLLRENIT